MWFHGFVGALKCRGDPQASLGDVAAHLSFRMVVSLSSLYVALALVLFPSNFF